MRVGARHEKIMIGGNRNDFLGSRARQLQRTLDGRSKSRLVDFDVFAGRSKFDDIPRLRRISEKRDNCASGASMLTPDHFHRVVELKFDSWNPFAREPPGLDVQFVPVLRPMH